MAGAGAAQAEVSAAGQARTGHRVRPAGLARIRVVNLHNRYLAHLRHVKVGKPAGIVYPLGSRNAAVPDSQTVGCGNAGEVNCRVSYQGGPVQHTPQVFVDFWGPNGLTDSGQQASAQYLEEFYDGLGDSQDPWSPILAQYGDTTGFPQKAGSALQASINDTSTPPTGATAAQVAAEADAAATRFASEGYTIGINSQIVVATQSGTWPACFDGVNCATGDPASTDDEPWCGYHDYSNEPFVNLPYIPDAGTGCNSNPTAGDGFTYTASHEYAESVTDPNPTNDTAWYNENLVGEGEIADECDNGLGYSLTLSTGTFMVAELWSNKQNACVATTTKNAVTVTSPGAQSTLTNGAVSLQMSGTDSSSASTYSLQWAATGLPPGLSISSSGLITGTATTNGTYTPVVYAGDQSGGSGSASFTWTVEPDTVTVSNPGGQSTPTNGSVSLQMTGNSSGSNPLTWSAAGLPPGLSIGSGTGLITGTATTNGTYSTTVTVSDSTDASDSVTFGWTVAADTVTVTQPGSQTGFAQAHASLQLSGTSIFGFTPLTWTSTGLPAGMTLNPGTGLITGAPAKAGSYKVTVTATDTDLSPGSVSFTWTVKADAGKPVKETSAGRCLTDTGSLAAAGTAVTVAACKTSGAQDWRMSASPGALSVFGLCLADPKGGGTGTHLDLAACKHAAAQEWTYKSDGEYVLKANGLCLTDPKDSKTKGTEVTITACKDSTSQKWTKP
jgi:hypothetical protein